MQLTRRRINRYLTGKMRLKELLIFERKLRIPKHLSKVNKFKSLQNEN